MGRKSQRVVVLNVVGLTPALLQHAPRIRAHAEATGGVTPLRPVFPAVTCSVQASMTTGLPVASHGVVGNGWYDRDRCEIRFWQRSDRLVHGEKIWETARRRDPSFTCANLFWWHNTYSRCDFVVQARPIYKADGRKIPDCYTHPAIVRDCLMDNPLIGRFPLFRFWGPAADIRSSRWIGYAGLDVNARFSPTLSLVYLPHLDYGLQELGPRHPDIPQHVAAIDTLVGQLIDMYQTSGPTRVLIVSEYGVEPTRRDDAGGAVFVNRVLRDAGLLAVREEDGLELLDPGASRAFAVCDHQVAHVYHPPDVALPDVAGATRIALGHDRAGDTVLMADRGRWFAYDYWPADRPDRAPDFARTVDIHRKPGYDPRELFMGVGKPAVAWKLLRKKLGFRQLMDVIPLDTSLVQGTHGRSDLPIDDGPLLIGAGGRDEPLPCSAVRNVVLDALGLGD
ncbi:MAG: nucleotide pyrophosphatase/phosphodiesterase family protein [Planctomycetota bacterium]